MTSRGSRPGRGMCHYDKKVAERTKPVDHDDLYTPQVDDLIRRVAGEDVLEVHKAFERAHRAGA